MNIEIICMRVGRANFGGRRSESVATTTTATTAGEEDYDRTPESRVTSRGKAAKKYVHHLLRT